MDAQEIRVDRGRAGNPRTLPCGQGRESGIEGMMGRLAAPSRALVVVIVLFVQVIAAQVVLPPGFTRAGQQATPEDKKKEQQQQPQQAPGQPPANQPGAAAQQTPAATTTPPQIAPAAPTGGLNTQNASLAEVIDILARQLKINYK